MVNLTKSLRGFCLNSYDMFGGNIFLLLSLVNFTTDRRLNGQNFTPRLTSQPKEEQNYSAPTIFFGEQHFSNPRTTSNSFDVEDSSEPPTASGEQDYSAESSSPSASGADSFLCSCRCGELHMLFLRDLLSDTCDVYICGRQAGHNSTTTSPRNGTFVSSGSN